MIAPAVEFSDKDALAYALRIARKKSTLTQADAAEYLGWARTTLVAIEAGQRNVSAQELERMASLYGTTAADLLQLKQWSIGQDGAIPAIIEDYSCFFTLKQKQRALIKHLLERSPCKVVVRSLQLVGKQEDDLFEIACALIHHLMDQAESEASCEE